MAERPRNPRTVSRKNPEAAQDQIVDKSREESVGISVRELAAIYLLDSIRGFGPQKFKELHKARITPAQLLSNPDKLPFKGKRADSIRRALAALTADDRATTMSRARRQLHTAANLQAYILTFNSPSYPPSVFASNNPVPALYVRGSLENLGGRSLVACVGSRDITPPYSERHAEFCRLACKLGFTIVSGFALGADTIGHKVAHELGGRTICVMPGGVDLPFPPENRNLWNELLTDPNATLVSEFPFGLRASALTLRKRNKLIVSFAAGVLVSQSSANGGAMNAYRFALEQKKPFGTFQANHAKTTTGNAEMAKNQGTRGTVFPRDHGDLEAYEEWLSRLSFST